MNLGLIAATVGLVATTELPVEMLGPIARLGAVGVLGFLVVWHTTRTQPAKDKLLSDKDKLFADSLDKLSTAINELRVNCAAKQKD